MDYLSELTDVQRSAVTHLRGPMLVLAGPGSGKTRVVTSRIAHLLAQGVSAHNILALTFTNKAAEEMRLRLGNLSPGNPVWMSTFHRFCSQLLRRHASLVGLGENFRIYDSSDSFKTLKSAIEDLDVSTRYHTPNQIARTISNAKNELATHQQFQSIARGPIEEIAAEIYPEYQKRLMASNAVDFDDLLMHIAILLTENSELRTELDEFYQFILVDEYQDTNLAQYTIVRALSINHPNLSVTGDPDQSIYAWRGADIKNILEFERDYPDVKVVRLEQNYRSTKKILAVADQLIANNIHRKEKSLFTENPDGDSVRLVRYNNGREEAEDIARQISECVRQEMLRPRDCAILFRTNALTRNFEHALREYGVPYQMVNGVEFYQRKEIKDILAYLHLVNNPRDEIAFLRVINTPARGIGKKSLQYLRDHAQQSGLSMLDASREVHHIAGLTPRARSSMGKFLKLFDGLCQSVEEPVEAIVGLVLSETGYRDQLQDSQSEDDQRQLANIEELVTAAKQFDDKFEEGGRLEEFLEQTSLVADSDVWDPESDKTTLMTLHAAKGLEFPVIYIVAVEQGILPHERSREDPMKMEEERRLLFVGITRAKSHLQLSLVTVREYRGKTRNSVPSPFLMELPRGAMECFGTEPSSQFDDPSRHTAASGMPQELDESIDEIANEWAEMERKELLQDATLEMETNDPQSSTDPVSLSPIMTATELLGDETGQSSLEELSPEQFSLGMLVTHPEYGPGKIIALSGKDHKRTGTIQFLHPPSRKKFQLAFSPVRPVG